jgi:uncharacterized protein
MTRVEAITKLKHRTVAIKALGATSLYVFGSTVRDEAQAQSDLDIFIDYDRVIRFNALDLVGIKHYLEDELKIPVDVTTRDGLHPVLKADIERSAIRLFLMARKLDHVFHDILDVAGVIHDRKTACPSSGTPWEGRIRGHDYFQSCFDASRAPSAIALNLAQAISGSTWWTARAKVAKPQSVPAITRSRPTTSA